ncbi:hypothetical protein GGTG_05401 [Gaeumannomyces tritici R3-111a-1]|uniref:Uncharacterized protein n=1 Tax=Gaeumannomyces tritici (strain R3-111a-1) TaxID=644352 RepID=J3NVT9_GAET3|nr:hypothetical protein GGTG_05401 [Gaeumannomyces tritici R3-111a-1]EJT75468.1 hypothetical protein GGTG_05401 [Gaeumannomyces tritici R3-111a-1]
MSEPSVRTQTLCKRNDDAQSTTTTLAMSCEDATPPAAAAAPLSPGLTPLESPHPGRSVSYSNRPLSGSGARTSRFIETPMFEYTPANSIYEEDVGGASRSESQERRASILRLALRVTNCASHLAIVVMLLAIMSSFLATSMWHRTMSPEAVVLVFVLSLDALFDLRALALCRAPWPGWALMARLALGLAYLATFMVYIGIGGSVFPSDFGYWGMAPGHGAPLVFLLMWLLGVWNLVHAAVHRHSFGSALGACLGLAKPSSGASAPPPAPAMAMTADTRRDDGAAGTGGGGVGGGIMAAVRGLGIRRGAEPGDDVEAGRRPASSRAGTMAPMMAQQSSDMDLSTLNGRPSRSHDDKTMDSTSTLDHVRPPTANRTG